MKSFRIRRPALLILRLCAHVCLCNCLAWKLFPRNNPLSLKKCFSVDVLDLLHQVSFIIAGIMSVIRFLKEGSLKTGVLFC